MKHWIPKANPWEPPAYDDNDVYAIRAVLKGVANEGQQLRFCAWMKYQCGADDISFRPDDKGGQLAMAFAEGKRMAWHNVQKFLNDLYTPPALNAKPQEAKPKRARKRKTP